jgi:two-component sensor histidine kinase
MLVPSRDARTHGLLTRERWAGASLRQIVSDELAPYEGRNGALTLDGAADRILPPKEALDFALLVHELATNAAKHGAFSQSSGRVAARWHIEPSDDGVSRLVFDWVESGGPPVERMQGRGFGLSLIESTFGAIPERSVELRFEPDGVRCTISMTLPGTTRLPGQAQGAKANL